AVGDMEVMLSRVAVNFIFDQIDIFPLLNQLSGLRYGHDEELYATLMTTPEIGLPGGFHPKCLNNSKPQHITRLTQWSTQYYKFEKF
ncbi:hypothetical protein PFISCL1PPCAC_271, partial [Pristionchus fissidentatus]